MSSRTTYSRTTKTTAIEKIKECSNELTNTSKYATWDNDIAPIIHIKDRAALFRALVRELMEENKCCFVYAMHLAYKMRRNKVSRYFTALQIKRN